MNSNVLNLIGLPQSGIFQVARMLNRHPRVELSRGLTDSRDASPSDSSGTGLDDSDADLQVRAVAVDGFSDVRKMDALIESDKDAKFVAVLRNPIDVAFEIHAGLWNHGSENEPDFDTAWELQSERCNGRSIPEQCSEPERLQFAQFVDCLPSLSQLWSLSSHGQRCVVLWDEFIHQPNKQTMALWEFAGLGKPPYWEGRSAEFGMELSPGQSRAKIRARSRDRLCDAFLDHIAQLASVTGRDLQHWLRRSNEIIEEDVRRFASENPDLEKTSPIELIEFRTA